MGALFHIAFLWTFVLAGALQSPTLLRKVRSEKLSPGQAAIDSDSVSRDQPECTETQCQNCSQCMEVKAHEPGCDPGNSSQCIDPAAVADPGSGAPPGERQCYKAFQTCGQAGQKKCVHLVMCNHPCVCLEWKQSECTESYAHNASQCELLTMLARSSHGQKDVSIAATLSSKGNIYDRVQEHLDDSLQDKCRG
jgi:hypothetical protein